MIANIRKLVAVKFDTFQNGGLDPPDPVREHIGININNMTSWNSTTCYSIIKDNRTYSCEISTTTAKQ